MPTLQGRSDRHSLIGREGIFLPGGATHEAHPSYGLFTARLDVSRRVSRPAGDSGATSLLFHHEFRLCVVGGGGQSFLPSTLWRLWQPTTGYKHFVTNTHDTVPKIKVLTNSDYIGRRCYEISTSMPRPHVALHLGWLPICQPTAIVDTIKACGQSDQRPVR